MDTSNALLSGVAITVEGDAIQGQRTAVSEANGSYRLLNLPPGEYRVTYQKSKFKTIVYEGAKVEVNKTLTMNVTMQIAGVEVTLVVTGSSPIVDVKNATIGTNFGDVILCTTSPTSATSLPCLPDTLASRCLAWTSAAIPRERSRPIGRTGLAGQSITTVDGVNITPGSDGVGAYLDYGALAEANVSAAGNSANVAVAGAAVTTVIKSGSNTHHGEFRVDFAPIGNKPYTGAENYLAYHDINGQFDGPLIKDRLWYFMSFRDQYNAFDHRDVRQAGRSRAAHQVSRSAPKRRTTPSS